ncbi:MAG TPA: SxtJ family membrane protein [Thermoanaerobaculia bacterium]|nr:SxtJ family membrane protein [Thermoanaerobaculia bacterium]
MSTSKTLRQEREFGLLVGGVLALIGAVGLWRGRTGALSPILLASGALLVLLGLFFPRALRWPYRGWMALADVLSVVVTNVILVVVYFGIVTPLGLLRRALGGDPLRRRAKASTTYWHPFPARQGDARHYEKMF